MSLVEYNRVLTLLLRYIGNSHYAPSEETRIAYWRETMICLSWMCYLFCVTSCNTDIAMVLTDLHGLGEPLPGEAQHWSHHQRPSDWSLLWRSPGRSRPCRQ